MGLNVSSAKWRPFCLGLNVLIKIKCSNGSGQCGINEIFIPCWHWWISDKQKSTKSYHVHDVASIKDVILCLIIRKFVMKCSLQLVTNITYCYMAMYLSANTQCWSNTKHCVICTGFSVIKPKTIRSHCLILINLITQNGQWTRSDKKKSRVITTPALFPSRHNLVWSKPEQFDWGRL